jgi:putative hydroxymethylpyrimidine transport system ATP-binding protein
MADAAPGLDIRIPRFGYGGPPLFEDFALTLEPGQWTCLLGASGSGKSTLLRLTAGLLAGAEVTATDGRPVRSRLALMAQQDGLMPWLSVVDNVTFGFRLRGGGAGARVMLERGREMLDRVGLADVWQAYPATLSGGMRQRAALARTLVEDRPVVLMDEPFSALDAITRHRLQEMVATLFAGRTVLLVTHSPLEALRLGHVVHVLGGLPAGLGAPIVPAGAPPRAAGDPVILARQGELLDRLSAAAGDGGAA